LRDEGLTRFCGEVGTGSDVPACLHPWPAFSWEHGRCISAAIAFPCSVVSMNVSIFDVSLRCCLACRLAAKWAAVVCICEVSHSFQLPPSLSHRPHAGLEHSPLPTVRPTHHHRPVQVHQAPSSSPPTSGPDFAWHRHRLNMFSTYIESSALRWSLRRESCRLLHHGRRVPSATTFSL
jgi:hypothetical protein